MIADGETIEPRRLTLIVFLLIYASPLLFVWLVLLPGYSRSLREAAFSYAFFLGFMPVTLLMLFL